MAFLALSCPRTLFIACTMMSLMAALGCTHSGTTSGVKPQAPKALPPPNDVCRMVFRRAMNLPLDKSLAEFEKAGSALKREPLTSALQGEDDAAYRAFARCAVTLSDCDSLSLEAQYEEVLRAINQGAPQKDDTCAPLVYRRAQQNKSLADYDVLLQKNADCEPCFYEKSVLRFQQKQTLSDAELVRALAHQKHPDFLLEHAIRRARANDPQSAALYEDYLSLLSDDDAQNRERTHRALAALYQSVDVEKYRQHLNAASALTADIELVRAQLTVAQTPEERFVFAKRLSTFDDATALERVAYAELAFSQGDIESAISTLDRVLAAADLEDELHGKITKTRSTFIAQVPGVRERPYQGSVPAIAKALRRDIEPLVLALPPKGNQLTRARIDVVLDLDATGTLRSLNLVKDTLGVESIARAIRINLGRAVMRSPGGTHRFALEFIYGKP